MSDINAPLLHARLRFQANRMAGSPYLPDVAAVLRDAADYVAAVIACADEAHEPADEVDL